MSIGRNNMPNNDMFDRPTTAALSAGGMVVLLTLVVQLLPLQSTEPQQQPAAAQLSQEKEQVDPFEDIDLEARAALVWDAEKQQSIYTKNSDTQLPLASLTKLMTALVANENLSKDARVVINKNDLAAAGDSGLLRQESWSPESITDFTLVESSNDGARALASAINALNNQAKSSTSTETATDLMNKRANELGLEQTFFLNPSGLDIEPKQLSGGYGTAQDITLLIDYLLKNNPDLLSATTKKSIQVISHNRIQHTATNTNKLVGEIPLLLASKTGYTSQAGGNLSIAFNTGLASPYIITVLGSTRDGRFRDVKKLYNATIEYIGYKRNNPNKSKNVSDNN